MTDSEIYELQREIDEATKRLRELVKKAKDADLVVRNLDNYGVQVATKETMDRWYKQSPWAI